MNSLGGILLPNGPEDASGEGWPYWSDRHQWAAVQATEKRTVGGALHQRQAPVSGGRPITLQLEQTGRLSAATAEALRAMADLPGEHALALDDFTATVAFTNYPKPVDLRPLWPFAPVYVGTIYLIEV